MAALYQEILAIARNYMGAAAEDYIRRRIRIVQKGRAPETIEPERLDRLAAGVDMTAAGYMSEAKAAAFRDEILQLKQRFPVSEAAGAEPSVGERAAGDRAAGGAAIDGPGQPSRRAANSRGAS